MLPWILLATASIPGGTETLRLMRRGADFYIKLGAVELMTSQLSGSEEALAVRACERLRDQGTGAPRLLIGGLGMGFTLRAALAALPLDARVVVAELVPAVIAWARGPLAELFGGCLDDPRVSLIEGDVGAVIRGKSLIKSAGAFDAILLDVDNGPDGLVRAGNDTLYSVKGLAEARRALRPGGLLAVWSVAPDAAFAARMAGAGFAVEDLRVKANAGKRGTRHVIWIGRR